MSGHVLQVLLKFIRLSVRVFPQTVLRHPTVHSVRSFIRIGGENVSEIDETRVEIKVVSVKKLIPFDIPSSSFRRTTTHFATLFV